ncbi:SIR2 family protein [Candidatus Solirubrobacter pratensis]|uniref:SIR2 family protein n=1 Tax=Candidatus Solirubrobacter pratensis TaxID=1298857 RepID=UPI0004224668|nr:SIR2 family protein [Candidatus Solirubrobacter pratensis]
MSFDTFAQPPLDRLIADAAAAPRLTVLLGAGASIEAGLPSWPALIERLLVRVGIESGLLEETDETGRRRWVAEAVRRDGYLGAAAIVDALSDHDTLEAWIPQALYGEGRSAAEFFPGPICRQLPRLIDAFGAGFELMTTNYDDLAEQGLRDDPLQPRVAVPYVGEHREVPRGAVQVVHLHGYAGRDGRAGRLVLSESDYQRMQQGMPWQEARVRTALGQGMFVFVGTSLADPNLIRYLYGDVGAATPPRYAIFVRQDSYERKVPAGVPAAREKAIAARWAAVGVTAVFVDHYVDVAQLLYEVARAKQLEDNYLPLPERARTWVDAVERQLLGIGDDDAFVRAQLVVGARLRSALESAVAAAEELEGRRWQEKLALTLWLIDANAAHLINRVTTDRVHIDQETVEPVAIDEHARWVAVRSFCRGLPLAETRDIYASRWHFIRGTPLVIDSDRHGRIPVGCLTTASMKGREETMLNAMDDIVEARFNQALTTNVLALLDQPFR